MSGLKSERELQDCPEGQKDADTGEVRKVAFDYNERCDFAGKCIVPCEHKKKT